MLIMIKNMSMPIIIKIFDDSFRKKSKEKNKDEGKSYKKKYESLTKAVYLGNWMANAQNIKKHVAKVEKQKPD